MTVTELTLQERIKTGCSHVAIIDYTDLSSTAGTTKTLNLFDGGLARDIVDRVLVDVVTPFDGGATSALKLDVGYNLASGTDDPDAFIDNIEVHVDATEILADGGSIPVQTIDTTFGQQEADAITDLRARRPFAAQEAFDIEALFTATGANLTALDTGRVRIYFNVVRLTDLRGINNT